jgi:ABC-type Mn2+/Zn2+ transport system ATPase subunit
LNLIGYACRHPNPPLREAFLALSELTVLLGPNDAGKSSLLRAVNRDPAAISMTPTRTR